MYDEIAEAARIRVEEQKERIPLSHLESLLELMPIPVPGNPPGTGAYQTFQEALLRRGLSVIAGIGNRVTEEGSSIGDLSVPELASEYEMADADAISYISEPHWFHGSKEEFSEMRTEISIPILIQDFIVDPYQIYEAKNLGADAVVLMCAILDDDVLRKCLRTCNDLYIDALVQTENDEEVMRAVASDALIIGVNCLGDKSTSADLAKVEELRKLIPDDCLFVVEYGIEDLDDARRIRESGADALLVDPISLGKGDLERGRELLRLLTEID